MKMKWLALILAAVCLLSACRAPESEVESNTQDSDTETSAEENTTDAVETSDTDTGSDSETEIPTESETPTETETESESVTEQEDTTDMEQETQFVDSFKSKDIYATAKHPDTADGEIAATQYGWRSTDFVEIGGAYAVRYELPGCAELYSVTFFDADKNFISGIGTDSFCEVSTVVGCSVIPEGAVYARFTYFKGKTVVAAMENPSVTWLATEADYRADQGSYPLSGLKVACLGDSITEGDYGYHIPANKRVHMENYPYYLAKKWGCDVTNYGWCGDTTETFWNRFQEESVDVSDADFVIIILGANLGLEGEKETAYRNLIEAVLEQVKGGATVVLCTPPHVTESTRGVEGKIFLYDYVVSAREVIFALAEEYDLPVIDIFAESPIQEETESTYQPMDGIHLNREGYEVLADFIGGKIQTLLG